MPESAKRHLLKGRKIAATLLMALLLPGQFLLAQPGGGVVTSGMAVIERAGAVTDINQSTEKASINWQSFNIKPNETVNFNQPGRSSVTLNRVIGNERSVLEGALNANGRVFLVNSSGILATKTSSINTGGFLASTLNITDEDFQAGRYIFSGNGKNSSVINQGTITARDGGYVALLGGTASNQGVITATKGTVALASGDKIRLNLNDATLSGVIIDEGTLNALVENNQAIYADGGRVFLTAKAANDLLTSQINMNGIIRAQTVGDLKGSIELNALGGETYIAGTLDASGRAVSPRPPDADTDAAVSAKPPYHADGGFIETSGDKVRIADSAIIDTHAENGTNGEWLIDPDGFTVGATTNDGDMSAAALNASLANNNVTIASTSGKGTDGNINVNGAVSWSDNTLTLNATNNVFINNVVTATGKANLTATYGSGTNKDETPMGLYTAVSDSNSRLDFSGTGALKLGGETYTVINSAAQLAAARSNPNGRYALGSSIDLATITNWTPLDNNAASGFTGKFNGLGHQIDNFTSKAASIFGTIGNNATVSNISVSGTGTVSADSSRAKTSAGVLADVNRGNVINASVRQGLEVTDAKNTTTKITATGLLAGTNYGLIAQSFGVGSINGVAGTTGGLVGINETGGRIIDSWGSGNIRNDSAVITSGFVGGLVGLNNGTVRRSYAQNTITLTGGASPQLRVGGFVGKNAGTVGESYAIARTNIDASSAPAFGGFVGDNTGVIENAYTTKFATYSGGSASRDAGFAYSNTGTIRNAYAVSNTDSGVRYGFARENTGKLENVYWTASGSAVTSLISTPGATYLNETVAGNHANYNFGSNMPDVWAVSKSGWLVLRNIPVVITSTSVNYGLGISITATGLQGGGWNSDNRDSVTNETYNPFTVVKNNGYVDAGVWNASNILSGSYYTNVQGFVRVNPKPLTISGVVANSVYDGTTNATLKSNVAKNGLIGLVGSQTLDVAYTSAAFQNKNAGNNKTVDITYTASDGANGGKLSNYILPTTTTANITPRPVSVVIVGNDKIYDGTTAATVTGQFSDVVAGDSLALAYASAYFDSRDAGNRNVTATGLSLTGADGGNYTLSGMTSATTIAAITRRPLQLFGFADEGGNTRIGAANLTATNIAEGDSVTLGGSVGISATAAGNQPITDFSALTVDNPNYTAVGSVGSIIVGGANLVFDRVAEGGASVTTSGKTTTVTQTTDKAVLDWMRLSLGKDETLTFNQPNSSSIVLNRVVTDLPSVIDGTLKANGRVFLLNAGGVLFTANSRVSVGALVASTFNLTNDDFLKSNYVFTVAQGNGSIISEGDIVIAENGFVALAGNHDVKHTGTINGGDAALFASTDSLTLTLNPSHDTLTNYAIGNLAGTTTVGGRINIGSATKGGELLTAGDTVTASGLNLSTGTSGAWDWRQNGDIAIGAGQFAGNFVNDNLKSRSLSLTSRNGDIAVNNAIDWSANTTLTLDTARDININKSIKATGANAGLIMDYGGDYHLITPATFSGAVLDATGKPVARTIPAGTEFTDIALSGANAKLNMNGDAYTLIHSMDELAALSPSNAATAVTATGYFALMNDLDASAWSKANTGAPSVIASMSGTLAGLGHAVDNLTLNAQSSDYVGFIGQMLATESGTANILRDIGIKNVDINGYQRVGALAGSTADAIISQTYSTGKIKAVYAVGGLVGIMTGSPTYKDDKYVPGTGPRIENSYSNVNITATNNNLGGLVGEVGTVTIVNSHATGNVTGPKAVYYYVNSETGERTQMYDDFGRLVEPPIIDNYYIDLAWASHVGGLLGQAYYANVDSSYATGNVFSIDGEKIGGLIGTIFGTWNPEPFPNAVTNSFATGNVTGGADVGGLIGEIGTLLLNEHYAMTVDNAYATGNVIGTRKTDNTLGGGMIGGLIGSAVLSNISNSWATGNVITIAEGRTDYMGGLVGNQNGGSLSNSYATGTVVGNGGRSTGGLVGNSSAGTSISDSYYQDASAAAAAETAPIRTETGGIMDDLRLHEPGNTRQGNSSNAAAARDGNRSALAQYIYQDDEDGYSARVKAITVEGAECPDDDEDCN